jgi:hypothetical protein
MSYILYSIYSYIFFICLQNISQFLYNMQSNFLNAMYRQFYGVIFRQIARFTNLNLTNKSRHLATNYVQKVVHM